MCFSCGNQDYDHVKPLTVVACCPFFFLSHFKLRSWHFSHRSFRFTKWNEWKRIKRTHSTRTESNSSVVLFYFFIFSWSTLFSFFVKFGCWFGGFHGTCKWPTTAGYCSIISLCLHTSTHSTVSLDWLLFYKHEKATTTTTFHWSTTIFDNHESQATMPKQLNLLRFDLFLCLCVVAFFSPISPSFSSSSLHFFMALKVIFGFDHLRRFLSMAIHWYWVSGTSASLLCLLCSRQRKQKTEWKRTYYKW